MAEINSATGWVELPTELLMKIFSHLRLDDFGIQDYQGIKKCLLNTRLVHPRWKLVMDELLEKWCMEFWTKWKATYPCNVSNRYSFPILDLNRSKTGTTMEDILCPPFLNEESRHSPTKSLCITERKKKKAWKCEMDFPKYGSNLTSITFFHVSATNPFLPKTLADVLSFTPNLKAIALQNVCFKYDLTEMKLEQIILPPLAHLEHVKVYSVGKEFVDWILKPYSRQLVTLETNRHIEWNPNGDLLAYQNLKRLKSWPRVIGLNPAMGQPPPLECLSLGGLKIGNIGPNTIQRIQKSISHFAATLVDFHMEVSNFLTSSPRVYATIYNGDEEEDEETYGAPFTNFTFPLLKTFWIFYPKSEGEVAIVKDFLQMFPALETLKFLLDSEEIDADAAKANMMEHQYWRVCPKLKTIRVQIGGYADNLIFRMEAPFI